jgi:hypothetical protein
VNCLYAVMRRCLDQVSKMTITSIIYTVVATPRITRSEKGPQAEEFQMLLNSLESEILAFKFVEMSLRIIWVAHLSRTTSI